RDHRAHRKAREAMARPAWLHVGGHTRRTRAGICRTSGAACALSRHARYTWTHLEAGNHQYGFGTLAHELGHALGLPHPDGWYTHQGDPRRTYGPGSDAWSASVMGTGFTNWPDVGLLPQDQQLLSKSPYITPQPYMGW